jgi:hypothetical protein
MGEKDLPDLYTEWDLYDEDPHEAWRNDKKLEVRVTDRQLYRAWKWIKGKLKGGQK